MCKLYINFLKIILKSLLSNFCWMFPLNRILATSLMLRVFKMYQRKLFLIYIYIRIIIFTEYFVFCFPILLFTTIKHCFVNQDKQCHCVSWISIEWTTFIPTTFLIISVQLYKIHYKNFIVNYYTWGGLSRPRLESQIWRLGLKFMAL